MSKVKSKSKIEKPVKLDEEMETSDDDYIDPKMEKYFQDTKDKIQEKLGQNGKHQKKNKKQEEDEEDNDFEDISDFEEEEEDDDDNQEEMDDEEQSDEEIEENSGDDKNEDEQEIDMDQRKKLTLTTINNWSKKLGVKIFFFKFFKKLLNFKTRKENRSK